MKTRTGCSRLPTEVVDKAFREDATDILTHWRAVNEIQKALQDWES